MPTKVIHIRDRKPGDKYIGRAGHGEDGYFGNPIIAGKVCSVCGKIHRKPADTLSCYQTYFLRRVINDPVFRWEIAQLRGKRLVCFCKPKPCHGDVIVKWLGE